jgi:hypothetical protein
VKDRVFVACVHGEGQEAAQERQPMLAVIKTAKALGDGASDAKPHRSREQR